MGFVSDFAVLLEPNRSAPLLSNPTRSKPRHAETCRAAPSRARTRRTNHSQPYLQRIWSKSRKQFKQKMGRGDSEVSPLPLRVLSYGPRIATHGVRFSPKKPRSYSKSDKMGRGFDEKPPCAHRKSEPYQSPIVPLPAETRSPFQQRSSSAAARSKTFSASSSRARASTTARCSVPVPATIRATAFSSSLCSVCQTASSSSLDNFLVEAGCVSVGFCSSSQVRNGCNRRRLRDIRARQSVLPRVHYSGGPGRGLADVR